MKIEGFKMNNIQPIKIEGFAPPNNQNKKGSANDVSNNSSSPSDKVSLSPESRKLADNSKDFDLVVERLKVLPEVRDNLPFIIVRSLHGNWLKKLLGTFPDRFQPHP